MKKLLGIAVLFALVIATILVAPNPFKVTDPADSRFDPDEFRFTDYYDHGETVEAFRKLFPVETSKEFVDHVLIDAGNADTYKIDEAEDGWSAWRYNVPKRYLGQLPGPIHIVIYDKRSTVDNIYVSAMEYLYPSKAKLDAIGAEDNPHSIEGYDK